VQTISITDVADATNLFNLVEQANLQNAEDAALHCDTLTLYELIPNTGSGAGTGNVDYTKKPKIFAGAAIDYATTNTPVAADKVVTATDILDAATNLKVNRAPTINGSYVMLAPPQVTRDIMQGISSNTVWVDVSKYSAPTQLFNGEVGKLYGVRVVEHTNVYRSGATEPTTHATVLTAKNDTGAVFHSHVFGRNAYGQPNLSTLGSPYSPSVSIVQGADKADPANLIKALCSWKTFWCAKVLQPKWIVHLYSQSAAPAA
jgi:N4-gp56 family major capsid protein